MKRKARIQTGIDDRLVAIYARKSRITNKGDSIGVQFKQSADYAINQLSLPEDYEFARYEDKGLSGYYSDRPDFQRLLRDIEMGKIKAVACYKLDRISRKTSDLMRLLEYFERHDVTLLVCSNNINTRISTSKIIIQVLAIIAEFERDILTERIQDNLMELAKDGRWLGGKTPTGFSSQRVTTGSGKNKSAISFLVPVQEEKEIVLEIYGTFWETRSLLQTANIINEKYETKHGAKFTTSTIRLILRNPIYCVADEYSYNYFLEHDGNLFGDPSDFDGQHGLTAYNKTDQMKVEDEDSTFFNPKFSQLLTRKPISEWIVSVGRHEGFISSREWVETQNMLDEIAEKYNRPHRKTNALLSGLMYCPICGKRLRVLPESNRWTNGKPRFKYACPGVRAKECTFKGVEGVTLDEFVIHSLSSLQEEHSDYYRQLLENRVAGMIRTDQSEKEYQETKKAIERLNADIAAQVRNLREADDALKRFIQDDIKELTDELAKREATLRRMEDTQSENQYLIHELNGMKKRLLSFEEFAKDAQPEALFTLVHSIVDRIYITTDGTKQKCQVYIKGCATEDYSDVLGAAGYIEEEPLLPVVSYMPPMCDLDYYSISATVFVKVEDKSLIAELKEDAERVDQLIGQLDLNQLSYSDKSSVEECRTAYNALSDRALQYVTLESNLVRAENEIKKIEASYQKQAEAVADQVDAVGEVTLEKAQLIEQCRMAYDALNDEAKQFVTNLAVLEEAEEELDFCRSADELDQLILSIGEVTLEKEEAVMRVYSAYSRLPESAKKKVQRYGILTAAVGVINTLKADKAEAERQAEEARKLAELEEQRSTEENTGYGIVYWTPKGKSYHSRESCPTLSRSKTILSGSVSEAKNSGHGDPCNICAGGS